MKNIFNFSFQTLKNTDFIQAIMAKGWKPYLVGGCVRDYIMNKDSNDIDMVIVGCEKDELLTLLNKYGKPDLVGESFAVISFLHKGTIYDISTPRTEKKIGAGHKGFEVISNKNITLEEDLFRRDITINSIAMDFNGDFIDPYNGRKDILNKIIKITNPGAFIDDPLRILRCIRFCARFNFTINKETSLLMIKIKKSINELPQERMFHEWGKVMGHAKKGGIKIMQKYIDLLTEYDLWNQMFSGMEISTNVKVDILKSSIIFYDLFENENIKSKRKYMIETLKFDSYLVDEIIFLQKLNEQELDQGQIENPFKLASLKHKVHISNSLVEKFAKKNYTKTGVNTVKSFLKYCDDGFTIDGNDLIKQGFKGKSIGEEKERLEKEIFLSYIK